MKFKSNCYFYIEKKEQKDRKRCESTFDWANARYMWSKALLGGIQSLKTNYAPPSKDRREMLKLMDEWASKPLWRCFRDSFWMWLRGKDCALAFEGLKHAVFTGKVTLTQGDETSARVV